MKDKYTEIREFKEELAAVCRNKLWGFINSNGIEVIPCIYKSVSDFYEGESKVVYNPPYEKNVIEQIIDLNGNLKTDKLEGIKFIPFQQIREFSDSCFRVCRNNLWGIINKKGDLVLNCQYNVIYDLTEKGAIVANTIIEMRTEKCDVVLELGFENYGLIGADGQTLIPMQYTSFINIANNLYVVKKSINGFNDFAYGLYDIEKKQESIPCIYSSIEHVGNNVFKTAIEVVSFEQSNLKWYKSKEKRRKFIKCLLDVNGRSIINCNETLISFPSALICEKSDKYYLVCQESKQGLMDLNGKLIIEPKYKTIETFYDGLAIVSICIPDNKNSNIEVHKLGLININGTEILSCEYDEITRFRKGITCYKNNNLYDLINKNGKILINSCEIIYEVSNSDELFIVSKNEKYGVINSIGTLTIPMIYDNIDSHSSNNEEIKILIAKIGDKYGVIDFKGNICIPFVYDAINQFYDGISRFEIINEEGDLKTGYINSQNKVVIPAIYDEGCNFCLGDETHVYSIIEVNDSYKKYYEIRIDKNGNELNRELIIDDYYYHNVKSNNSEYVESECYDEERSIFNSPFYDDNLDLDQQSPDFWDDVV